MEDLPKLIEERFRGLAPYKNDIELFEKLRSNPALLLLFFEQTSEDETWSERHLEFCRLAFELFTRNYLDAKLERALAVKVLKLIQEHHFLYSPILSKPITFKFADREIGVNPIPISVMSPYLAQIIHAECIEKNARMVEFSKLDPDLAAWIFLYMETGESKDLFRWDSASLKKLLEIAEKFSMDELASICEKLLVRYVTDENCDTILIEALSLGRDILLEAAIALFNKKIRGLALFHSSFGGLGAIVSLAEERAFEEFGKLAPHIHEVKASPQVVAHDTFWSLIRKALHLRRLDISGSDQFSVHLLEISQSITDLDISSCGWLTEAVFHALCEDLYWLQALNIAHNLDLSYRSLSDLRHLKELRVLDISYCSFVGEEELNLIVKLLPNLRDLRWEGCLRLDDEIVTRVFQRR